MKKIVLLSFLLFQFYASAQDFWTEYATAQPESSTGISSISIVDENVSWLNMTCTVADCTPIRRYSRTLDGGLIWNTGIIDLGPQSEHLLIGNIAGTSSSVAYASVYPAAINTVGGIWHTTDSGATWNRQPSAAFSNDRSHPRLVYFWGSDHGLALGDPADGYFEAYITENAGNLWTRIPVSPALIPLQPDEYLFTNNFAVTGNTIWMLTTYGRLLKSVDRGLSWAIYQGPVSEFLTDTGFEVTADIAFTNESSGLLQTNDFRLFYTFDGGANWTDMSTMTTGFRSFDIAAIPGLPHAYVSIGEDLNGERGSSYSLDAGITWRNINNYPDLNYVDGEVVEMLNITYGLAGGLNSTPTQGGVFKWNDPGCGCGTKGFSGGKCMVVKPDPQSGIYNIIGENIDQVIISDTTGKQIASKLYNSVSDVSVDTEGFTNGLYFIRVINDKASSVVKIVKQ